MGERLGHQRLPAAGHTRQQDTPGWIEARQRVIGDHDLSAQPQPRLEPVEPADSVESADLRFDQLEDAVRVEQFGFGGAERRYVGRRDLTVA